MVLRVQNLILEIQESFRDFFFSHLPPAFPFPPPLHPEEAVGEDVNLIFSAK